MKWCSARKQASGRDDAEEEGSKRNRQRSEHSVEREEGVWTGQRESSEVSVARKVKRNRLGRSEVSKVMMIEVMWMTHSHRSMADRCPLGGWMAEKALEGVGSGPV